MNTVLQISQMINAIGLLIIGGIGAWIAVEQRVIAKQRLAVELFDKRFNVLRTLADLHKHVLKSGVTDIENHDVVQDFCILSRVLFSESLQARLYAIRDEMRRHIEASRTLQRARTPIEQNAAIEAQEDAIAKLVDRRFPDAMNALVQEIRP